MTTYTAPCVGGPLEGQSLPYDLEDGVAFPHKFLVADEPLELGFPVYFGQYVFIPEVGVGMANDRFERRGTGDTWRWHPFIGSIK